MGRIAAAALGVLVVAGWPSDARADEACDGAVSALWSDLGNACGCEVAPDTKWRRERVHYVRCVREFAASAVLSGSLSASCQSDLVRAARNSTCARPASATPCCKTGSSGETSCKIVNDASNCSSSTARVAELGSTETCLDACANASGPVCSGDSECNDNNVCTIDWCEPETGCVNLVDPACNPSGGGGTECSGTGTATHGLSGREQTLLKLINDYRKSTGKPAAKHCTSLSRAAQDHANDMRDKKYFAHKSKDGTEFWERACRAGYKAGCGSLPSTYMGEIIAGYDSSAEGAMWQWTNSPGHAAIMKDSVYTVLGIGHACGGPMANYWVVDFAGKDEASCN